MNDENRTQATVYSYWDDERGTWRHSLTEWDRPADETHEIMLPNGFDLYETEGGETFAYRTDTEPRKANQYRDAWKIVPNGDTFSLVDAHGVSDKAYQCKTID